MNNDEEDWRKELEMSEIKKISEHAQMSKKQDFFEHTQKSKIFDEPLVFDKVKPVKRCPKCHGLALTFDVEAGKIHCDDCGYEESIQTLGDLK